MADLFQGQTMSEAFQCLSNNAAHTFTFNFQPDKVVFNNLTDWTGTAGGFPKSTWFRTQTAAAQAHQQAVIDSSAGASFNFIDETSNGFTVANTSGGMTSYQKSISAVSKADPCVVTTSAAHGYISNQLVRITDLGSDMPTPRGMDQIDGQRYKITVLTSTTFSLQDPISGEDIDSSAFTTYVSGGYVILESRVLRLNNPEADPANPYVGNPFIYDPVEYKLTAGTAVMGGAQDTFLIEAYKFGQVTNLGQLS